MDTHSAILPVLYSRNVDLSIIKQIPVVLTPKLHRKLYIINIGRTVPDLREGWKMDGMNVAVFGSPNARISLEISTRILYNLLSAGTGNSERRWPDWPMMKSD